MNKNKVIQSVSIIVIVISALVSGYILLGPNQKTADQNQNVSGLAPMVDGKQVIKMTVFSTNYSPEYFTVKAGVPVKWEITSSGEPGCDSGAIIANGLLKEALYLNPNAGQVTTKEFTPQTPGTYKFSCTMNMVRGTIQVIN